MASVLPTTMMEAHPHHNDGGASPSLSPSQATPAQLRSFSIRDNTSSEGTVPRTIIPIIAGDKDIQNLGDNEAAVKPVPDLYHGAPLEDLPKAIRDHGSINTHIVPTKHRTAPAVPNVLS